ncbi:Hypothetical protein D9617_20g027190 [Elsinoe fawcettii]|nr:Hypothetical protein D9617_20g027190 [Elsinoe fawcettii]
MAASERQEVIIIDSEDDASPRKSGSKGLSTTLKASAKAPSTAYKPSPQRRPPPATTPTNATRRDPLWNPLIPDDGLEHARPFADDITEISRPTNFGSLRRPNGSGPTSPDTSLPSPASSSMFSEASLSQPLKRKRPDGKYQAYVHGVNSQKRPKQPSFSPRRPARQPENGNAVPKPDTAGPVLESAKTDHSRTSALANASNADAIPDQTTSYSSKQVLSDKHPQASMAKAQLPPSIKSGAMSLEAHMNALTQALPRPTSTSTTTSGKSEKPGIRPNAGRVGPPVNGFPGKLLADLLQERRTPTVDVSASQVGVTERSRKPNEIKSAMHGATTNTASPTSRPSNLETIRNQNLSRSNGIPPQRSSIAEATSDTESKGIAPPNPRPEVRNERFRSGYSEPDTGSYIPSANIASRLTPQVSKSVRPSTKIDHLGHRGQKLNGRGDRREPARPRLPSGTTQAVKVAGQPNSDHTHSNVDSPSRRVSSVLGPMNKSFDLGSDALNTTKHNGNVTKPPSSRFKERETDTIRTTTNGTLSPHSTSTQADSGIPETSIEALQGKQSSKIVQTRTPESSRAVTPKTLPTDDQASSFFAKSPLSKSAMADMPPPTMIPPAAIRTISTKLDVEESLVRNLTSLAEDQKYMVKMALAKARSVRNVLQQADLSKDQPSRVFTDTKLERVYVNGMIGFKRPNPFQFLKPLHRTSDGKPDGTFNAVTVETVDPGAKRIRAPARMVGCRPTRWQDKNKSVPTYTHCTQVKKNVAAPNQKVLHSYPYFGENVDEKVYEALHTRYDIDVPQRNRKVLQSQQSRYYMRKLRQWLEQIGSSENDVLFYLLNPRTSGEQGDIYASRNKHCKEDFNREGRRWTRVFEELDKTNFSIKQVQVAAWACDTFLTKTGMSIWQVVRKAPVTDLEDASDDEEPFLDQIQEFACRVCHEHDCPYHIDFEEDDSDDSYDEDDPVASAEALDVDHPPDNNLKRH